MVSSNLALAPFAQIFFAALHPSRKIDVLILQGVRKFVRHDRFLLLNGNPVEQIYRLGFRIVVAGHLFL